MNSSGETPIPDAIDALAHEPRNKEELRLCSTDDLRRLYQIHEGNDRTPIRLRDGLVTRGIVKAEILRRTRWERLGGRVLLAVTIIGAVAAVIAAIEGWRW